MLLRVKVGKRCGRGAPMMDIRPVFGLISMICIVISN